MVTLAPAAERSRPRLYLPYPHPGQQRVYSAECRINIGCMGRRWWKTSGTASRAAERALRGERILWGAPTYDQARIGWDEIGRMAREVARFHETRFTAFFPNGGQIVFRSLDNPDNARGFTLDGVVIDEASEVAPEAWYTVIRPTLMSTNGWAWLIGTPKGRNWFWAEHSAAGRYADTVAWNAPTLGCRITPEGLVREPHPLENPYVPFGEIVRLYETMTERDFRQEILAEFLESAGGIFRGVRAAATAQPQGGPVAGHTYVMGVDWGKYNDATVLTVLDATTRTVAAVERIVRIDTDLQVGRLETLYGHFRPLTIVAEENAIGIALVEQLERRGLPVERFVTTAPSKKLVIDALALAIERGELMLLSGETTIGQTVIGELEAFETTRLPGGGLRYAAPANSHDDCVISLALAWHALGSTAHALRGVGLGLGRTRGW